MEVVSEFVVGVPHPRLRPFVGDYSGYRIRGGPPGVHVGLPSKSLTFIVAFDDPVDVDGSFVQRDRYWAMLAGLHARPAMIRHDGHQHGVQLSITPAGVAALFGIPAGALAHQVLHLDAVVPDVADELVERLSQARSWRARWAILDAVLLDRLSPDDVMAPELAHAWSALVRGHGAIEIGELADSVGWSRPHLSRRFTTAFGMSPKVISRVVRFERAQRMLRLPTRPSLASIAAACGYADQAHMTRDFHEFAGSSPTAWMADEMITFVQDT
ncbi:MAG: helix-turn-helix domain-containing protein [Acidimicrobiales bacterium]